MSFARALFAAVISFLVASSVLLLLGNPWLACLLILFGWLCDQARHALRERDLRREREHVQALAQRGLELTEQLVRKP